MIVSPLRRLALVGIALTISTLLLRAQISSALVTRGDSLAYWGKLAQARRLYARALLFDPRNETAADRYAFGAVTSQDAAVLASAVPVVNRAIAADSGSVALHMDRALVYHKLRKYSEAAADFQWVGQRARDARALVFAAFDERRLGRRATSVSLAREAVATDRAFLPAHRALDELAR